VTGVPSTLSLTIYLSIPMVEIVDVLVLKPSLNLYLRIRLVLPTALFPTNPMSIFMSVFGSINIVITEKDLNNNK
jgi:hypothetical protein